MSGDDLASRRLAAYKAYEEEHMRLVGEHAQAYNEHRNALNMRFAAFSLAVPESRKRLENAANAIREHLKKGRP